MGNIFGAIIALGVLITVHELGHFLAARIFGVDVEKFSLGFGPRLIGFKIKETDFRISLIPLGGYLKMKGDNPDEEVSDETGSFRAAKWYKRAAIAFAGPFANLLFAFFIFILSFAIGRSYEDQLPFVGKIDIEMNDFVQINDEILSVNNSPVQSWSQIPGFIKDNENNTIEVKRDGEVIFLESSDIEQVSWFTDILPFAPAIVGEVAPGLPAYRAGLMPDDEIIAIDGIEVKDWYDMRDIISESTKNSLNFKIKRDDKIFEKVVELEINLMDSNKIIGITQKLPVKLNEKFNLFESIKYGSITTISFVALNYATLYKLISKPSSLKANLGGPVMIYTMSKQTAKKGLDSILAFIAAISIMLMIMNLLPIPILDGGHIFFCFIEGIFKKPLTLKSQLVFQRIGLYILLSLMLFAFFNDFSRIFSRNVSLNEQKILDGN